MKQPSCKPFVAIACGGTGGHLYPGLAVAEALRARGCDLLLLVSPKEVDQQAIRTIHGMQIATIPAVGLTRGRIFRFAGGVLKSLRACQRLYQQRTPQAVLAMGGFTSVAPVVAGKFCGASTFLHESNTVPGRANRWLSHLVDHAFTGFPSAGGRLSSGNVMTTGTPVRPQFEPGDAAGARMALGLDSKRPVLLVMGGSQGAAGINDLILQALPAISTAIPELQFVHLSGEKEFNKVQAAFAAAGRPAVVRPFLSEMELAMSAATLAVSRAGASSLAELAAMRLPSILIPYPAATDNHQYFNARALRDAGGAVLVEQRETTAEKFAAEIIKLLQDPAVLNRMRDELVRWHSPRAAEQIADKIMVFIRPLVPGMDQKSTPAGSEQGPPLDPVQRVRPPSVAA